MAGSQFRNQAQAKVFGRIAASSPLRRVPVYSSADKVVVGKWATNRAIREVRGDSGGEGDGFWAGSRRKEEKSLPNSLWLWYLPVRYSGVQIGNLQVSH